MFLNLRTDVAVVEFIDVAVESALNGLRSLNFFDWSATQSAVTSATRTRVNVGPMQAE